MKKNFFILLFITLPLLSLAQFKYSSRNGNSIPAKIKMRALNILINIVYDQTPERDPLYNDKTHPWQAGKANSINDNVPTAMLSGFMNSDLHNHKPTGWVTKYFYESSLGNFIYLGDFIIVNIAQSAITPDKPGKDFTYNDLIKASINLINQKGGVRTVFGHDSISDYDFFERGKSGLKKSTTPNGKIDFIQVILRNSGRTYEGSKQLYNYGQHNPGEGNFFMSAGKSNMLKFYNSVYYEHGMLSCQNLGMSEFSIPGKSILIHEFSHALLGGNGFHASGGNHYGTYSACTFIGIQGGWGIIGGYSSSLISCNAYERWRLGWFDSINNPDQFAIAASGKNSDINKASGRQTFILRDFVSTGDAIRIQLPYVDENASNQYLWLENHQVGKNGKLDFLQFSNSAECRDAGTPGIYSYIQVGRDIIEGNKYEEVFPLNETDNLRVVNAKGNWDMELISLTDTVFCVAWKSVYHSESCNKPNPLSGYVDQQTHFFDTEGNLKSISDRGRFEFPAIVYRKGKRYDNLPYLGDNLDAFTDGAVMDIGTNPAPVNTVTYYVNQGSKKFNKTSLPNTRSIYLSGLYIKMQDLNNGTFKVDIGWDDYEVKNNTRWTGKIILHEKLILQGGKTILLDQNYTPNQLFRDSISGYFSPTTNFVAKTGSEIILQPKSKLVIDNGSTMILEANSKLTLNNKAQIILKKNACLFIKEGVEIINKGGKILKKANGKIIKETQK
ncbi:MAG: hypothetical protein WC401_02120 [Bacteroidales bacterium]|nr:hypothetical protein [Bacteroidales bacterium]